MKTLIHKLKISTNKPIERICLTNLVCDWVQNNKLQNGVLTVASMHTTAGIVLNEKCTALDEDFIEFSKSMSLTKDFKHNRVAVDGRPNALSHMICHFLPSSVQIVVADQKLLRGEWQEIFFIETDGPRSVREVLLHFWGE